MTLYKRVIVLSGKYKRLIKINKLSAVTEIIMPCAPEWTASSLAICQGKSVLGLISVVRGQSDYHTSVDIDFDCDITALLVDSNCELLASGATIGGAIPEKYLPQIAEMLSCTVRVIADGQPAKTSGSREEYPTKEMSNSAGSRDNMTRFASVEQADILHCSDSVSKITSVEQTDISGISSEKGGINCDDEIFYSRVAPQIEELFNTYPTDHELEELVIGSRWVRIDYDNENYYVVGIISDDDMPQFICYGAPSEGRDNAGNNFGNCEWLPLDRSRPLEKGYWVLYQSAIDGEMLTI